MGLTDIRGDLVERLPERWRPYALLLRLDRPTGWWLLLLPGWWGIVLGADGFHGMRGYDWYLMILFFVGAIVMRGAGCIVNDLWDRDLDTQVERTKDRPLAAGALSVWQAGTLLFFCLFAGFTILLQTSGTCIFLGFASLLFIAAYPYMKRITWWPQAFLGLTFNFGALMGWAAATHGLALPALILYAAGFFWTLGYDTIYAHQDKDDDLLAGIKSTALLFGTRSKLWVAGFYALSWGFTVLALWLGGGGIIALCLMALPALHLIRQLRVWEIDDPASALRVFQSGKIYGLLVLLSFFALGV